MRRHGGIGNTDCINAFELDVIPTADGRKRSTLRKHHPGFWSARTVSNTGAWQCATRTRLRATTNRCANNARTQRNVFRHCEHAATGKDGKACVSKKIYTGADECVIGREQHRPVGDAIPNAV